MHETVSLHVDRINITHLFNDIIQAASRDRTRCMPCGSSTSGFDPEIMDCTCAGGNQVLVEKSATNEFLPAKECMSCGIRGIPDSNDRYKCMICPDERMVVDNGQCVCSGGFVKVKKSSQCVARTLKTMVTNLVISASHQTY